MRGDERPASAQVTTWEQLNQAIAMAEGLLDRAERTATQCRILRAAEVGITALAIFTVTGWIGLSRFIGGTRLTIVSVIGVLIGIFVATTIFLLVEVPLRKRLARDSRAIVEIVGLVQELKHLVAGYEEWSELQSDLFDLRVSRFPIGPGGIR